MEVEKEETLIQKKTFSPKTIAILDSLRLLDDDFMTRVFDNNYPATELLLKVILNKKDIQVKEITVQKVEKSPISNGRSITLDIYAEDSEGKHYDIEIQRSKHGANIKRARFHSAVLDSRMLEANDDFSQIDESYVLFITEKDVIGRGQAIYPVSRCYEDTKELFDDGNHIIYVNGAYKNDETPIGRLMHDFRCTSSIDMFYTELREPTHYFKETEGGRAKVCEAIETYGNDMKNEGIEKGRAEGKAEGMMEKARAMAVELFKNGVAVPTIAVAAGVPDEVVHGWIAQ